MSTPNNAAELDLCAALAMIHADVQASVILSKTVLQALAAVSPALGRVAQDVLDIEIDEAPEGRTARILEETRIGLALIAEREVHNAAIEDAIVAAAEALDLPWPARKQA